MKHLLLCAVLFIGLVIALDNTAAVEGAIGDTTIELVAPVGYCPLDRKDWPESRLLDFTSDGIKKQGDRLAYFVDCERVRSWHEGGSSKDKGDVLDYQASHNFRNQNVTSVMLEQLCATVRKDDDSSKGWLELFVRAFKSAVKGSYSGEEDATLTNVVLGYEDTGCYVFSTSMMKNRDQVYTVSALIILKSRLVTVHRSRKFGNIDLVKGSAEDVIRHLMTTSREIATALIAANQ